MIKDITNALPTINIPLILSIIFGICILAGIVGLMVSGIRLANGLKNRDAMEREKSKTHFFYSLIGSMILISSGTIMVIIAQVAPSLFN